MALATLIVAAIGSLFTAVAAVAAWRAASTTRREARERSHPYVAVGTPRADYERHAIVVPLKNLGLGPARTIALQLKLGDVVVSARIAPGLAPMESEEWVMFLLDQSEMLDPLTVSYEGSADDAGGDRHPLHAFGGTELAFPSFEPVDDGLGPGVERSPRTGAGSVNDEAK